MDILQIFKKIIISMGNCKTKEINTGSKYYFNDFDDMSTAGVGGVAPGNINNAAME